MKTKLTPEERATIDPLLAAYSNKNKLRLLQTFQKSLLVAIRESDELVELTHSIKDRIKDPEHLKDKLARKFRKCQAEQQPFDVTAANLFTKINDLAGIRILHLHTKQVQKIDAILKSITAEQGLGLLEGPFARTWDDEYRRLFQGFGFQTLPSDRMYTSVHYVLADKVAANFTCEIQVRTLMEEVWGEVDHSVNYPHQIDSVACREQILALARSTSAATRLVDSIFESVADFEKSKKVKKKKNKAQP